jgi:dolichol kinase
MSDAALFLFWLAILLLGLLVAVALARAGMATTHVRDVLHVGAGVWPLGWPAWHSPFVPVGLTVLALLGMAGLPRLAGRFSWLSRVEGAVSGPDEAWSGLVLYTLSSAVLTALGFVGNPFPAAAALLALALGDGLGGALGLAVGRRRFRVPWGKPKSLEGSLGVALFSTAGVFLAARWFSMPVAPDVAALAGVVAAVVEAISPRATDNLFVPASVWVVLEGLGRMS